MAKLIELQFSDGTKECVNTASIRSVMPGENENECLVRFNWSNKLYTVALPYRSVVQAAGGRPVGLRWRTDRPTARRILAYTANDYPNDIVVLERMTYLDTYMDKDEYEVKTEDILGWIDIPDYTD